MYETDAEVAALQALLDASIARSTEHLRAIIHGERVLSARDLVALLTGMKVLTVATVTARGEPRISAVDGHFLHATWTFSTSGTAAKARHLRARPAVSVAHVDNEALAVFGHGAVEEMAPGRRGLGRDARPLDAPLRRLTARVGRRHPPLPIPAELDGRLRLRPPRAARQPRAGG